MIRFALICEHEHEFEGWFRSNDDFDTQKKRGFVDCPSCGSHKVQKALMAPAVVLGPGVGIIALTYLALTSDSVADAAGEVVVLAREDEKLERAA